MRALGIKLIKINLMIRNLRSELWLNASVLVNEDMVSISSVGFNTLEHDIEHAYMDIPFQSKAEYCT